MVHFDLDRRLAEAAADVESLREASQKLDQELEARQKSQLDHNAWSYSSVDAAAATDAAGQAADALEELLRVEAAMPMQQHKAAEDSVPICEHPPAPEAAAGAPPVEQLNEGEKSSDVPPPPFPSFDVASMTDEDANPVNTEVFGSNLDAPGPSDSGHDDAPAAVTAEQALQASSEDVQAESPDLDALWNEYLPSIKIPEITVDAAQVPEAEPPAPPPAPPPALVPSAPTEPRRHAPRPRRDIAQDTAGLPSDRDVAAMSRKERIRLLEYEELGASAPPPPPPAIEQLPQEDPPSEESSPHAAAAVALGRAESLRRAREGTLDSPGVAQPTQDLDQDIDQLSRRERIALLERTAAGGEVPRSARAEKTRAPSATKVSPAQDDNLEDDSWLETRRQHRKMRLQQHASGRPAASREARTGASAAAGDAGAEPAGLPESERLPPQQALEELAQLSPEDPRYVMVCTSLSHGAHKLTSAGLVRAVEVLAVGSTPAGEAHREALKLAGEAVISCLTPQLNAFGTSSLVDVLQAMAVAGVQEQTFLDMLLAQLLVLLRKERGSISPPVSSSIAGSLGKLHEEGLSAKRGASGASSAANRRCVEALSEMIASACAEFTEEDVALTGGSYLVNFMDDTQRRALLHRAAELEAGLQGSSSAWVAAAMCRVERSVRSHSFAFVASLPDQTKDYLMRLKALASADRTA
eukprot:TRINITY_DN14256_c0_g1_i2.p1 TRINITY_DN14256_c0_g1~~TRINITY_DN14256_c0_g1_i2.p1  ORF type:complete len:697 (+),score=157.72 TRINITY_DN14256_c0_g1_i2:129-2219(+)